MKRRCAMSLALVAACRFGGPSAKPEEYVALTDAAAEAGRSPEGIPGDDAGSSLPPAEGSAPPDDTGMPGDGGVLDDATEEGACSASVAVCDPVHNTGCNPLQQCDISPLQTSVPTGQCVFGGAADSGLCTVSIVNESCAPRSTCVDGGCRQLCFCNADCPAGQCCSDRSGPAGFSLCRPCP
jgi:hypothetical protein